MTFWNRYGRTLYNASTGQVAYNASYINGTARRKPVLRTTSQSRIQNSEINWALGFFGTSFQLVPYPTLANFTSPYDVVIIPEGGTENNTLASYDSCPNDNVDSIGYIGDDDLSAYIPKYLSNATQRLQAYLPSDLQLTTNDTYAMQSICAYETQYIGQSDFCLLFTADEWSGFEYTTGTFYLCLSSICLIARLQAVVQQGDPLLFGWYFFLPELISTSLHHQHVTSRDWRKVRLI